MPTYSAGPVIVLRNAMTRHQFIDLCERASAELTKAGYGQQSETSVRLAPEGITEGGIEWTAWPGKEPKMYKTIRLGVDGPVRWPWISGDEAVSEEWRRAPDETLLARDKYYTFLKAFYGAPKWTREEVETIMHCFREFGAAIQDYDRMKL